ncbi:hypothetical protein PYW07_006821 [Mythimna separata]|uniref:Caveolin n=1 Tax=Mythimna separata TaxID=271217 RepID=A0AAD7Z1W9_MYTSE|nr:hypothetical protein PYW07_006821 [Mythimna separata]
MRRGQGVCRLAFTVAFEDVPLGSGGAAVPKLTRTTSRQCIACEHKAKLLPDIPEPVSAPPVLIPTQAPVIREQPAFTRDRTVMTTAKPESMRETLEDRDPNSLNQHVQIVWDDIIGEPEGARSPECAWRLSHACFRLARNWCYTALAVLLAPPCALLLGCGFACLAFEQIWCTAPCLRCVKIYFASLRTMVMACMAAVVEPAASAVGHVCRHIRVNFRKEAPEDKDMLII